MYRKSSLQGGRRSSQLRRLSAKAEAAQEKEFRNPSEGKKSLLPRPSGYTSRSSSMERDGPLGSTSKLPRAASDQNLPQGSTSKLSRAVSDQNFEVALRSHSRSRSSENLTTPRNPVKTPGTGSRLTKPSTSRKSGRKETRPLADRGFQNLELSKVQQYLLSEGIIEQNHISEVRSTMSTKLFIHIMNGLLKKLFPSINITTANYCEEIKHFMKKLKYPGTLSRSTLLSTHAPHSWPHVLGIISWLTQILPVGTCPLKYLVADPALEHSEVDDVISYSSRRYVEWNEKDDYSFDEDKKFFDDLFKEKCEALDDEISKVEGEVKFLEECKRNSEEENEAWQREYDNAMADLALTEEELSRVKEDCENLRLSLENGKEEMRMLDEEIEKLQSDIPASASHLTEISDQHIEKIQSDILSVETKLKFLEQQENEMRDQGYSLDLRIARTKADIDKTRLQRDACLRECVVSEHIGLDKLNINVDYNKSDYKVQLEKYKSDIAETLNNLRTLFQGTRETREQKESKERKLTENLKQLEEAWKKADEEYALLEKKLAEERDINSRLEENNKISKEMLRVMTENLSKKEQMLKVEEEREKQLIKENAIKEEKIKEDHKKYSNYLAEGAKSLEQHIEWCKNKIRDELGNLGLGNHQEPTIWLLQHSDKKFYTQHAKIKTMKSIHTEVRICTPDRIQTILSFPIHETFFFEMAITRHPNGIVPNTMELSLMHVYRELDISVEKFDARFANSKRWNLFLL